MAKSIQRVLHCPCGEHDVVASGLCRTCYNLKRQDEEDFGGLREKVLDRDGRMCRVCAELPEVERLCVGQPLSVHHRVPGVSKLHLMITLCAAHHAIVERLAVANRAMPPLLRKLWREQHPKAPEQARLSFRSEDPPAVHVPLFEGPDHSR